MGGINRIQERREEQRTGISNGNQAVGREIWFKDGDQAFITSLATGHEDDSKLDEFYIYTYRSGNRWVNLLSDPDTDTSDVPSDTRPSHKFGFWAFVHEVIHPEKRVDSWEEVAGPGGKKMYKEVVNDYRLVALTFGRSDYIWNQLVDVYNDWGQLDKGVMRIKRSGSGMLDTSYAISATARDMEIPNDKFEEQGDLPAVKEYFRDRYGSVTASTATSNGHTASSEAIKLDELF